MSGTSAGVTRLAHFEIAEGTWCYHCLGRGGRDFPAGRHHQRAMGNLQVGIHDHGAGGHTSRDKDGDEWIYDYASWRPLGEKTASFEHFLL